MGNNIFIVFIVYTAIYIFVLSLSSTTRNRPYKFEDIFESIILFITTLILLLLFIFAIIEYIKLFILG